MSKVRFNKNLDVQLALNSKQANIFIALLEKCIPKETNNKKRARMEDMLRSLQRIAEEYNAEDDAGTLPAEHETPLR